MIGITAFVAAVAGVGTMESGTSTDTSQSAQAQAADRSDVLGAPMRDMTFTVGPAEIVFGLDASGNPSKEQSRLVDGKINGFRTKDGLIRAYMSHQGSWLLEGRSIEQLKPYPQRVVLDRSSTNPLAPTGGTPPVNGMNKDPESEFDRCGVWMNGVRRDPVNPKLLHGWYHAESFCHYQGVDGDGTADKTVDNQTRKSIAYVVSRDEGLTWTKVRWPHNQVATSPHFQTREEQELASDDTGLGDFSVVLRRGAVDGDDYYYMYFNHRFPPTSYPKGVFPRGKRVGVARAKAGTGGPGSWRTLASIDANGREHWVPSLLGDSAHIEPAYIDPETDELKRSPYMGRATSLHKPTGTVMIASHAPQHDGLSLAVSKDGTRFQLLPQRLFTHLEAEARSKKNNTTGDEYLYTSIMGPDGSNDFTDTFYIYNRYSPRYEKYGMLVRRKVTVKRSSDRQPHAYIALSSNVREVGTGAGRRIDRWDTTVAAPRYTRRGIVGYVATSPEPNTKPLRDCIAANGDRFAAADCPNATVVRTIGYVWKSPTDAPADVVPLLRCKVGKGATQNDYVTTAPYRTVRDPRTGKVRKVCAAGGTFRWTTGYVRKVA